MELRAVVKFVACRAILTARSPLLNRPAEAGKIGAPIPPFHLKHCLGLPLFTTARLNTFYGGKVEYILIILLQRCKIPKKARGGCFF